jgi:hypothetical protein
MFHTKPQYRKERMISTNDSWRIRTVAEIAYDKKLRYRIEDSEDRPRTIYFMASDRELEYILMMTGINAR